MDENNEKVELNTSGKTVAWNIQFPCSQVKKKYHDLSTMIC